MVGSCAQTGQAIDIDDASGHPRVIDTLNGTGSGLCVPVLHKGDVLAALNAEGRRVGAFHGQRGMLEIVADQIAAILRAAQLLGDIAETNRRLRAASRALETMAGLDGLTGIASRRCFDRWLLEGLAASDTEGRLLGLLSADVDRYKACSDGHGHLAGNACLRKVAEFLREALAGTGGRLARRGSECRDQAPSATVPKVSPARASSRSTSVMPIAAPGVHTPPGVRVRSTSRSRHSADSAIILQVEP